MHVPLVTGYPDVITDDVTGRVYITEAYKWKPAAEARTHAVSPDLIRALYTQPDRATVTTDGIVVSFNRSTATMPLPTGSLPNFFEYPNERHGFTFDIWIDALPKTDGKVTLVDASTTLANDTTAWHGVRLSAFGNGTHEIEMRDTKGMAAVGQTDPTCSVRLSTSGKHHVGVIADGGPKMLLFVVDGKVCDGGPTTGWPNGFKMFDTHLGDVGEGVSAAKLGKPVVQGRLYRRALYTSELVGNWRAGVQSIV